MGGDEEHEVEADEAEGADTADNDGKAKVLRLGWVLTQF
jgi:hypothetical protein